MSIEDDDTRVIHVVSTSDTDQRGEKGDDGEQGLQGVQGEAGKAPALITRAQALALFFVVVLVGILLSWVGTSQANKIERQQAEISTNTASIREAQYQICLQSVLILSRFNAQQTALADIEQTQTANPKLAKARIKAYEDARVLPLPECTR